MRLILVTLALAINGAIGSPQDDDSKGTFEYTINGRVDYISSLFKVDRVYFKHTNDAKNQGTIVFTKDVNDDNPLYASAGSVIETNSVEVFDNEGAENLNLCSEYDHDWQNVLVTIITAAIFPDEKCPIAASTHVAVTPNMKPITVNMHSKIWCGDYVVTAQLGKDMTVTILFNIPDDDNCNPPPAY